MALVQSEKLRIAVGDAGLVYVKKHHVWRAINTTFEEMILKCCIDYP